MINILDFNIIYFLFLSDNNDYFIKKQKSGERLKIRILKYLNVID